MNVKHLALLAGGAGLALAAGHFLVVTHEYRLRRRKYFLAREAAQQRGKPLLVIGRPGGWPSTYDCGDVTLDLDPRVLTDCPEGGQVGDVRQLPFADKQFGAVFCSHVLDCLSTPEDVDRAYGELCRVADEVFLCYTLPHNIYWRWISREVRVWINEKDGVVSAQAHPLQRLPRMLKRWLPG
jgi:hypothetical protein